MASQEDQVRTTIRVFVEIAGVFLAVAGAVFVYTTDQYVLLGIVLLVTLLLSLALLRDARLPSYTLKSVDDTYAIDSEDGSLARVTKRRRLRVNMRGVFTMVDRSISGAGDITLVPPRNNERQELIDEGESYTVHTWFPAPLAAGEVVEHEIRYVGHDCIASSRESVAALTTDSWCPKHLGPLPCLAPGCLESYRVSS
jgi:hypothetical protein